MYMIKNNNFHSYTIRMVSEEPSAQKQGSDSIHQSACGKNVPHLQFRRPASMQASDSAEKAIQRRSDGLPRLVHAIARPALMNVFVWSLPKTCTEPLNTLAGFRQRFR